jgi:hypothetical protein
MHSVDLFLEHIYLNTNFVAHLVREAVSRTVRQVIPKILRKPAVYYHVLGSPVRSLKSSLRLHRTVWLAS